MSLPCIHLLYIHVLLTSTSGIFKPCHSVVPPKPYFGNCVYDMCGTGGQTVALCQAIESYADLCAAAGVPIKWRNNTFCRKFVCMCVYSCLPTCSSNFCRLMLVPVNVTYCYNGCCSSEVKQARFKKINSISFS